MRRRTFNQFNNDMRIYRKKIDSEALADMPARDIARCCGVSERTARSWREHGPPEPAARLLALASGDMEAIAGRPWRDWTLTSDSPATLVSPDGQHWTPSRLGSWWIERQQIDGLRSTVARYQRGVPIIDRDELDRLQRAADAAQRFTAHLAEIYPNAAEPGHKKAGTKPAFSSIAATG